MMLGALTCPFGTGHMGVTAENVAAENQITREAQDAFALESQARAAAAIGDGRFAGQIVPVEVRVKRETRGLRHRRASEADDRRGPRQAAAGVPEGRHGHRRQRQRPQRRGGGDRARHRRGGREGRADAEGAGARLRRRRGPARGHGHRADPGGARSCLERIGLAADDFDVIEFERGLRGAGARGQPAGSGSTRRRSTRTAAPSRSATRSAPPGRS